MSNSRGTSQPCRCVVHKKIRDNLPISADIEDSMELTSLFRKSHVTAHLRNVICPLCAGSIKLEHTTYPQYKQLMNNIYPFVSDGSPLTTEELWNTIIVNQIPVKINGVNIDCKKFFSRFSQYGKIKNKYLCRKEVWYQRKYEKVARITFVNEKDARKVWEDSKKKMIKYKDHVLMITLTSEDNCPIEDLPDDCLRLIFKYITEAQDKINVESVCRRFRSISRESWSSVTTVSTHCQSRTWKTIISRAAESLRHVKLSIQHEKGEDDDDEPVDSFGTLILVLDHLINLGSFLLERFFLSNGFTTPEFHAIIFNNQCLKRICLWEVDLDEDFIDLIPAGIEEIQINSTEHVELLYSWNREHSEPVNVSRFGNLQVLSLFNFIIVENQLQGFECLQNLRVLKLKLSDVHPSNIEKIVNFTKLEHLAIPNCQISDVTLSEILKNNKGLEHLDLSDIKDITDSSFQHVSQLPHLQVLLMQNLTEVTDESLTAMSKLKELNCNGCPSITDKGIQRLFTPNSKLEKLYIADCSITLQLLKNACKSRPTGAQVLSIYVNGEMAMEWNNSSLKKSLPVSSNRTPLFINEFKKIESYQVLSEDYREIFQS